MSVPIGEMSTHTGEMSVHTGEMSVHAGDLVLDEVPEELGDLVVCGNLTVAEGCVLKAASIKVLGHISSKSPIEVGSLEAVTIKAESIKAQTVKLQGLCEIAGSVNVLGSFQSLGSVVVRKDLIVGYSLKAQGLIRADTIDSSTIWSGRYIRARVISALYGITAESFIRAEESLVAGGAVIAIGFIKSSQIKASSVFSHLFEIDCAELITDGLPLWREYYASMPPLQKWKDRILDPTLCWDTLKDLPTKEEAIEICNWEGWHWSLKAQLEMYLGLKRKVITDEDG